MNTTPVSLLERLRQPAEPSAWPRFVQLYTPLLYHWARRTGLQAADAADLVQDVLTLLVQKLPEFQYDGRQSFRGWLRMVTLNQWRDHCKRKRPGTLDGDVTAPDDLTAFEEAEYRQQLVARALRIMQADFQPATWKACWQHVVHERPAAAVARELGMTVGAVYAAKFRVLGRLRQELAGLID